jgi:hypothetical protein
MRNFCHPRFIITFAQHSAALIINFEREKLKIIIIVLDNPHPQVICQHLPPPSTPQDDVESFSHREREKFS